MNSSELERCVTTVCAIRILLLVARVRARVVLISALFPVSTWALFMMPYWLAYAEDKKKIANKDLVLDHAQILRSPKVVTLLCILVPRAYDPSGLRQESRGSGSNHFEITKEITEFCPSSLTQSSSIAHARNGCSQSLSIPAAGQKDRRLWGREWLL